ncbi:GTPase-associated system all-helical protein GASH [Dokdonia sp.]|uniref:GTPase-associated system all-helical protein GASH n=1 Tax=Dokdonia sp. TaxID=2024995 RepID=UPI0032670108
MSTILQKFIDSQLIQLKNDDEFQKLKDAATNLSQNELKKKENVSSYVLCAFDPNIDANEICLEKTKTRVIKQSPTVLSQSNDTPRTILRAVILESLYTRALNDIDYARIFWYIGSNVINYYSLGNEEELLHNMLTEIGEIVEKEAIKEWSLINGITIDDINDFDLKIKSSKNIQSHINTFKEEFKAAFSYKGNTGHNYVYGSDIGPWVNNINDSGTESISKFVKNSIKRQSDTLNEISTQINEYMSGLTPFFEKISSQAIRGVSSVNNRSQLLWWKESLYSPSMKKSYRDIPIEILALVIAFDLYTIVTQNYPVSVDYILKETLRNIKLSEQEYSFDTFIKNLSKHKEYLQNLGIKHTYSDSRISLLNYITALGNDEVTGSEKLKANLGIDSKNNLKVEELAVWLFHEFQAYRVSLN